MSPSPAPEGLDLVQVGFPMFVLTASAMVMRSLDRLIILRYLGNRDFGFYSISMMALTFLLYMPDAVTYVMYPRLLRQFGEDRGDPSGIRARSCSARCARARIFVPCCPVSCSSRRRPSSGCCCRSSPGVGALRALAFGALGLAFANFASVVLMTVGRQAMLMPTAFVAIGLGAALDLGREARLRHHGRRLGDASHLRGERAVLLTMALTGLGLRGRECWPAWAVCTSRWGWPSPRLDTGAVPSGADASLGRLLPRMLGSMLLFSPRTRWPCGPLAHGIGIGTNDFRVQPARHRAAAPRFGTGLRPGLTP